MRKILALLIIAMATAARAQYTPPPYLLYTSSGPVTSTLTTGQLAFTPPAFLAKCMNGGLVVDCSFSGGGGGTITSVTNSDGTLTFVTTTGAVVGSLNLSHANNWLTTQAITMTATGAHTKLLDLTVSDLNGNYAQIALGRDNGTNNKVALEFGYVGANSNSNFFQIDFFGIAPSFTINPVSATFAVPLTATSYSGTLVSSVTGTTQAANDNSTKIATTAYVNSAASSSSLQTCVAASASGTTYTCTTSGTLGSLTSGATIAFQADVANTGAITLNVNSLGAKNVNKQGGHQALVPNDIIAGQWMVLTYDGTQFQDHSQIGVATLPTFTWDNQNGGTVTNIQNTERLQAPNDSNPIHMRYVTAPATPYTLTVQFVPDWTGTLNLDARYGPAFRQSSTGKITNWQISKNTSNVTYIVVDNWTNSTTFSADVIGPTNSIIYDAITPWRAQVSPCLRLRDDGTNLSYWYSLDCLNFTQVGTNQARGAFMTGGPDQIGYFTGSSSSGSTPAVTVAKWQVTSP